MMKAEHFFLASCRNSQHARQITHHRREDSVELRGQAGAEGVDLGALDVDLDNRNAVAVHAERQVLEVGRGRCARLRCV